MSNNIFINLRSVKITAITPNESLSYRQSDGAIKTVKLTADTTTFGQGRPLSMTALRVGDNVVLAEAQKVHTTSGPNGTQSTPDGSQPYALSAFRTLVDTAEAPAQKGQSFEQLGVQPVL